jgi:predicted metal-dependent hydrolase
VKPKERRSRRRSIVLLGVAVGMVTAYRRQRLDAADIAFPEASRQR